MRNLYEKPECESITLAMESAILLNRGIRNYPTDPGLNPRPASRLEYDEEAGQ